MVLAPILSNVLDGYNATLDGTIHLLQVAALVPLAGAAIGVWNAVSSSSVASWLLSSPHPATRAPTSSAERTTAARRRSGASTAGRLLGRFPATRNYPIR